MVPVCRQRLKANVFSNGWNTFELSLPALAVGRELFWQTGHQASRAVGQNLAEALLVGIIVS